MDLLERKKMTNIKGKQKDIKLGKINSTVNIINDT